MRPTFLQFRSPKERTPDAYNPQTTYDGRSLSNTPLKLRSTLPKTKRFPLYSQEAKRTGFRVGPGRYDLSQNDISRVKAKGVTSYKTFHANGRHINNGYYYIGNHLVYDPEFVIRNKDQESVLAASVSRLGTERRFSTTNRSKSATKQRTRQLNSSKRLK